MEFIINQDNSISGKYYYRKHLVDIDLEGERLPDGSLQIGENRGVDINRKDIDDPDSDKHVDMVLHSDHQGWQGVWTGHNPEKPKHLAIHLLPLKVKQANQLNANLTAYDQERVSGFTLKKQELTHFGKYDVQWWIEPISKIRLFRVVKGYPIETMARINAFLASEQLREIADALACPDSKTLYDNTLSFINERVISIRQEIVETCGLNYASGETGSINLDVKRGKSLNLEDIFLLENSSFKTPTVRNESGITTDNRYEDQILSPWLFKTLTELYPKKISNKDNCDYDNKNVWAVSTWYITPKGLAFTPFMGSRGYFYCHETSWAIIPWDIVNQHQGILHLTLP